MAKRVAVLAAVFLALSLADIISAFRFRYRGCPDGVEETRPDASDGDEPVVLTNDYILQFFVARTGLIDSNCTSLFLGQTVSPHLCNSNSIQFQFSQGKISCLSENLCNHTYLYTCTCIYTCRLYIE